MTLGFGRGSKELGIPTANFNEKVVDDLPKDLETGIYFGWTNLEGEAITRKAVVSIGYNPFYENKTKSVVRNCIEIDLQFQIDFQFFPPAFEFRNPQYLMKTFLFHLASNCTH